MENLFTYFAMMAKERIIDAIDIFSRIASREDPIRPGEEKTAIIYDHLAIAGVDFNSCNHYINFDSVTDVDRLKRAINLILNLIESEREIFIHIPEPAYQVSPPNPILINVIISLLRDDGVHKNPITNKFPATFRELLGLVPDLYILLKIMNVLKNFALYTNESDKITTLEIFNLYGSAAAEFETLSMSRILLTSIIEHLYIDHNGRGDRADHKDTRAEYTPDSRQLSEARKSRDSCDRNEYNEYERSRPYGRHSKQEDLSKYEDLRECGRQMVRRDRSPSRRDSRDSKDSGDSRHSARVLRPMESKFLKLSKYSMIPIILTKQVADVSRWQTCDKVLKMEMEGRFLPPHALCIMSHSPHDPRDTIESVTLEITVNFKDPVKFVSTIRVNRPTAVDINILITESLESVDVGKVISFRPFIDMKFSCNTSSGSYNNVIIVDKLNRPYDCAWLAHYRKIMRTHDPLLKCNPGNCTEVNLAHLIVKHCREDYVIENKLMAKLTKYSFCK